MCIIVAKPVGLGLAGSSVIALTERHAPGYGVWAACSLNPKPSPTHHGPVHSHSVQPPLEPGEPNSGDA